MSRHGYQDDIEQQDLAMWRGRVASALRGKRGQQLLIDLRMALDAMPEKRLITKDLVNSEGVCSLGCVGQYRKLPDLADIDPEDHNYLAGAFNVAECMVREIEYENDEGAYNETPEQRWERMRRWVESKITTPAAGREGG